MGFTYEGGRGLEDFFDSAPLDLLARRIVNRVADYLEDRVREYTPVGQPGPGVADRNFVDERRGRVPGTLKESWEQGEVEVVSNERIRITVFTRDPVGPYVEEPTRPHTIRARTASVLRFRDSTTGDVVFATEVHHPGTEGSHMMARALQETALMWQTIAREELARWERQQVVTR